jgi:hypothetical protein
MRAARHRVVASASNWHQVASRSTSLCIARDVERPARPSHLNSDPVDCRPHVLSCLVADGRLLRCVNQLSILSTTRKILDYQPTQTILFDRLASHIISHRLQPFHELIFQAFNTAPYQIFSHRYTPVVHTRARCILLAVPFLKVRSCPSKVFVIEAVEPDAAIENHEYLRPWALNASLHHPRHLSPTDTSRTHGLCIQPHPHHLLSLPLLVQATPSFMLTISGLRIEKSCSRIYGTTISFRNTDIRRL